MSYSNKTRSIRRDALAVVVRPSFKDAFNLLTRGTGVSRPDLAEGIIALGLKTFLEGDISFLDRSAVSLRTLRSYCQELEDELADERLDVEVVSVSKKPVRKLKRNKVSVVSSSTSESVPSV